MTLEYKGQAIDIGGTDSTFIWHRAEKRWVQLRCDFQEYEMRRIMGKRVKVVPRDELIAYKSMLDRRVDRADLAYLREGRG